MTDNWSSFESFLAQALDTPLESRQALVDTLLRLRPDWPWVQEEQATFIYARPDAQRVAINLDTIKADPPFVPMENLPGTSLWYTTIAFAADDLLDYMVAVNDPMTPLAEERNIEQRVRRYWHTDPYNALRITTPQMKVSVLRMGRARPFPDWIKLQFVSRGRVDEHQVDSVQLRFKGRTLWVYTPPGYDEAPDTDFPLLILMDGQWASGPLQVPAIADALIKHGKLAPVVIAMIQSGSQADRLETMVSNDKHYAFLLTELLPYVQTHYRINPTDLGVGGVGVGAVAAAHAALKNPAVFSHLMMVSPPLGKGLAEEKLRQYPIRFERNALLPARIFQSVGRYEMRTRFRLPAYILRSVLNGRSDTAYKFVEIGSGHGLVAFRSVFPEALAWAFPGEKAEDENANV